MLMYIDDRLTILLFSFEVQQLKFAAVNLEYSMNDHWVIYILPPFYPVTTVEYTSDHTRHYYSLLSTHYYLTHMHIDF